MENSSLDDYSIDEELPDREVSEAIKIVGQKDIDPRKLAAKMNRLKGQMDLLKSFMSMAKEQKLMSDYEKIRKKYN